MTRRGKGKGKGKGGRSNSPPFPPSPLPSLSLRAPSPHCTSLSPSSPRSRRSDALRLALLLVCTENSSRHATAPFSIPNSPLPPGPEPVSLPFPIPPPRSFPRFRPFFAGSDCNACAFIRKRGAERGGMRRETATEGEGGGGLWESPRPPGRDGSFRARLSAVRGRAKRFARAGAPTDRGPNARSPSLSLLSALS